MSSLFPSQEDSEREQARARVWMRLGCGGQLCALCLLVSGAAVAFAGYQSSSAALHVLAALLVGVGVIALIACTGANWYGFVRLLIARVGR